MSENISQNENDTKTNNLVSQANKFVMKQVKDVLNKPCDLKKKHNCELPQKLFNNNDDCDNDDSDSDDSDSDNDSDNEDINNLLNELEQLKNSDTKSKIKNDIEYPYILRMLYLCLVYAFGIKLVLFITSLFFMFNNFSSITLTAFILAFYYYLYGAYLLIYMIGFSVLLFISLNIDTIINNDIYSWIFIYFFNYMMTIKKNISTQINPYYNKLVYVHLILSYIYDVMRIRMVLNLCEYIIKSIIFYVRTAINKIIMPINTSIQSYLVKNVMNNLNVILDIPNFNDYVTQNKNIEIKGNKLFKMMTKFNNDGVILEKHIKNTDAPKNESIEELLIKPQLIPKMSQEEDKMVQQIATNMFQNIMFDRSSEMNSLMSSLSSSQKSPQNLSQIKDLQKMIESLSNKLETEKPEKPEKNSKNSKNSKKGRKGKKR